MTDDAAKIPEGVNVKLFMRHSIREENPPDGNYEPLMLTKEGIALAEKIGASIDRNIGFRGSSKVKRCIQTVECVTNAVRPQYQKTMTGVEIVPALSVCLGNPQSKERGGVGWFEYFHYLQENNTEMTKGITLRDEALPLLDSLFAYGGRENELDVFCTHDCCVVNLASALFDLKTGIHGENWCGYAEGLFLYGTREKFTALWRGEKKEFVRFLR